MNIPLVSVILPVYNAELYVEESIKSVLNQTFTNFELIIINDGSTDLSENKILSFNDNRINYIKNDLNLKLIATLNLGLQKARGKYIARIDADDIALPERFAKQVEFLEANPDYGLLGSFAKEFGFSSNNIQYPTTDTAIRYAVIYHNPFVHSSVMIRSSILVNYDLMFDVDQIHVEDYDLWIRILSVSKVANLPECLVLYRVHADQISKKHLNLQLINTSKIQSHYLETLGFDTFMCSTIISLLNQTHVDINSVVLFLKKLDYYVSKIQNKEISSRIETDFRRLSKDMLLSQKQLEIKSFFKILGLSKCFTFKQLGLLFHKTIN
jgi:glycosyltransferase involved in cell wall biosynthesis